MREFASHCACNLSSLAVGLKTATASARAHTHSHTHTHAYTHMLSLSPVHHQHEAAERLLAEKRELLCDLSDERDRFTALRHRLEELDSSSTRHRSRRSGATVPAEAKGATVADRVERLLQLLSSSTSASSASITYWWSASCSPTFLDTTTHFASVFEYRSYVSASFTSITYWWSASCA